MDRVQKLKDMLAQNGQDSFLQHALAMEYIKAGNDAVAKELLLTILDREPGYVGSYYHLGKLLERNNEAAAAIEWYGKGMQAAKEAGDGHAYNELLSAYEDLSY